MKLVHAADLHVDSPLAGLERYDGAPLEIVRHATRRALSNLVRFCIEEAADVLLLAGDLFDGSWRDFGTGLFFAAEIGKLREVGTRVVFVRGNHDAASMVTQSLRFADHVFELSTRAPETRLFEDLGLAVHGQGYRSRVMNEDLASRYPAPLPGLFNVGILHTSLDGRPRHEPYAPTRLTTLIEKGYDYWALGHVHAREVVSTTPYVVYPGNLQGRHANETGAKGATKVEVSNEGVVTLSHHALDVVRWERLLVSAEDAEHVDDMMDRARTALEAAFARSEGLPLSVRIVAEGSPRPGSPLVRDARKLDEALRLWIASEHGARVYVERVKVDIAPRAAADEDETSVSFGFFAPREHVAEERIALEQDLADLEKKLPAEARAKIAEIRAELLDDAIARAEAELRAHGPLSPIQESGETADEGGDP